MMENEKPYAPSLDGWKKFSEKITSLIKKYGNSIKSDINKSIKAVLSDLTAVLTDLTAIDDKVKILLNEIDLINCKDFLCFTAELTNSVIGIDGACYDINQANINELPIIYYSYDLHTWTNWKYYNNETLLLRNIGDKVWLYGDNPDGLQQFYIEYADDIDNIKFVMTGKIAASGNILSLISKDMPNEIPCADCYCWMFNGCASLTQAPELPATTLADGCYGGMFCGCTSLAQAPELPATTLTYGCYTSMFLHCTSLTQAPELPATRLTLSCYEYMFRGCTSLTQAPKLPATRLTLSCYEYMFEDCTSLTQASELPATTLAYYCYERMFRGCTSLTQAPELPATTLTDYCYSNMFYNCTKLSEVTTYATSWNTSYANGWLFNVSTSGAFYNLGNANIPSGTSGIPSDWTVLSEKSEKLSPEQELELLQERIDDIEYVVAKAINEINDKKVNLDGNEYTLSEAILMIYNLIEK